MREEIDKELLRTKARVITSRLAAGLGKVPARFVGDMVYGMLASDSVRLTRIAQALGETIPLHSTHKRLSRNLANRQAGEIVAANLLEAAAELVSPDALLVVDTFGLAKPHARKMQHLGDPTAGAANDASADHVAQRGYRVCEVFGWDVQGGPMPEFAELANTMARDGEQPVPGMSAWNRLVVTPLAQTLWSNAAPGFRGESQEVLGLVDRVARACGGRGVFALDATADPELLSGLVAEPPERLIVRLPGERELLRRGRAATAAEVARTCETPYGITVYKRREGFEEGVFIHFGFAPVRLPALPDNPLWLIVIKGLTGADDQWDPLLLITNEPMRRSREVLWRPVWSFLHYWDAVITNRGIKRQFDFDDVRVLGYNQLRNIGILMQAAAFVEAQWPGLPLSESLSRQPRKNTPVRFRAAPQ